MEQAVEFEAAQFRIALGCKPADRARNDAPLDFVRRLIGPIEDGAISFGNGVLPFVSGGPVERSIGIGKIGGRAGHCCWVEPIGLAKSASHPNSLKPLVAVAWVAHRREAGTAADLLKLNPSPPKQRSDQLDLGARSNRTRAHPGQASNSGTARKAHQQGFSLIVGVVRSRECIKSVLFCPITEQPITLLARPLLDRCFRDLAPTYGKNAVGHSKARANTGDEKGLVGCLGSQAMVDGSGLDLSGPRGSSKKQ